MGFALKKFVLGDGNGKGSTTPKHISPVVFQFKNFYRRAADSA